jgi:endonuclease-3
MSLSARKNRAQKILSALKKIYPKAGMMLRYENTMQLLVAVMLSAQCTDKKVNEVTERLFKKYKTPRDFAHANQKVFEKEIFSTGFYRAKTKNIIAAAHRIESVYGGQVPHTMEDLLTLPGVARKTANIVLGNVYGHVEGIAVDTHVKKFATLCGLSIHQNTDKIEQDLMRLFPKKEWFRLTYRIIEHGRDAHRPEHKNQKCLVRQYSMDSRF